MGGNMKLPLRRQGMQCILEFELQSNNGTLAQLPTDLATTHVGIDSNQSLKSLHGKATQTATCDTKPDTVGTYNLDEMA